MENNINKDNLPITIKSLSELNGKKICIDIGKNLHQGAMKNDMISIIFNLITKLLSNGIKPLFVFDGSYPNEKDDEMNRRKKKKENAKKESETTERSIDNLRRFKIIYEDIYKNINSNNAQDLQNFKSLNSIINSEKINRLDSIDSFMSLESIDSINSEELNESIESIELNNIPMDIEPNNVNTEYINENMRESLESMVFEENSEIINNNHIINNCENNNFSSIYNKICKTLNTDLEILELKKIKNKKKSANITKLDIKNVKKLFKHFGIPYIHLDYEADIVCANLVKTNLCDYCLSDDMDLLAFGCNKIIRNLSFKTNNVSIYNLENILNSLKLTYQQFIDLCILCGTDYTSKIIGLKGNYILELIHQYNNIDNIIENFNTISDEFYYKTGKYLKMSDNFNFNSVRKIYNTSYDKEFLLQKIGYIDFDKIKNSLIDYVEDRNKYFILFQYCSNNCKSLNNYLIKTKLTSIFEGYKIILNHSYYVPSNQHNNHNQNNNNYNQYNQYKQYTEYNLY